MNFSIGIRNSIDKTHSVGFCAGKRVFVCDNLIFSGEFVIFRKHTGQLELGEIQILAKESLEALIPRFRQLNQWHNRMKKIKLTDEQASLLACAAMRKEILPASKYPQFHNLYFDKDTKYTPTLHGFHGACTEIMMNNSLLTIQWKNDQLNRFLNFEAPQLITPRKVARVDFVESEKVAELNYAESRKEEKEFARATSQEIRKKAMRKLKEQKKAERTIVITPVMKKALLDKKEFNYPCGLRIRAHVTDLDDCSRRAVLKKKKEEKQAEALVKSFHTLSDLAAEKAKEDIIKKRKSKKKEKPFVLDNHVNGNPPYKSNDLKRCVYCRAILYPKEKSCHNCGKAV
jgi:hypothetical protein